MLADGEGSHLFRIGGFGPPVERYHPGMKDLEEARRLMYVGMTRAKDRLVFTRVAERGCKPTGGYRFLDEMDIKPIPR